MMSPVSYYCYNSANQPFYYLFRSKPIMGYLSLSSMLTWSDYTAVNCHLNPGQSNSVPGPGDCFQQPGGTLGTSIKPISHRSLYT